MRCVGKGITSFPLKLNSMRFAFAFRLFNLSAESFAIKYLLVKSIDLQYNGSVNKLFVLIT
jgi:hypothetical protein